MKTKLHFIAITFNSRTYYPHWTFLLIIAWMVIINLISVVRLSEIFWGILLLISFVFSLLLHESAHALAGNAFGFKESNLLLLPSGSVGGGIDSIKNFRIKTIVLLAGPMTNLAIAFLLKFFIQPYSAYWNEPANIGVAEPGNFLFQLHLVNLSLGLVNLIPVLPTDGGRIVRGLLSMMVNPERSAVIFSAWTKWAALACLLLGLFNLNLLIILLAIYILATRMVEEQLEFRERERHKNRSGDPMNFFLTHSHHS
jgi:Zn-dependent protease